MRPKYGGRTKGTPNKFTKALKDLVLGALADAGGQEYLRIQALVNPTAFLALVGKVLPLQLKTDGEGPHVAAIRIVHMHQDAPPALPPANEDATVSPNRSVPFTDHGPQTVSPEIAGFWRKTQHRPDATKKTTL